MNKRFNFKSFQKCFGIYSSVFRAYQEAFCVFGGDGIVTKKYLKLSMLNSGHASSSEVEEMLETLDTDNDGNVQLEDFLRWESHLSSKWKRHAYYIFRIFVDKERYSINDTRKHKCQIL